VSDAQQAVARAVLTVVVPPAEPLDLPDGSCCIEAGSADWPARLAHAFGNRVRSSKHEVAIVHEPLAKLSPVGARLLAEVIGELRAGYARVRMGEGTADEQGARGGANLIATLKRAGIRWLASPRTGARPWHGLPAFVVSAGPSLDINVQHLREAARIGPVIAVNTAVAPLLHHGIEPHAVVAIESKSVQHLLRDLPRHVPLLLEARAHPTTWDLADHPIAFLDHESALARTGLELGLCPTPYSTTVAGAAISLALQLGAGPIVLVGQDLAYTGMRCYASHTACDSLTISIDGANVRYHGSFGFDTTLAYEPLRYRDGWGGAPEVPSILGLELMAQWIERVAQRHVIINATEGGSTIAGTKEMVLADVIDRFDDARHGIPNVRLFAEQRDTQPTLARLRAMAERVIGDESIALPPADGHELYLWCAGAIRRSRELPMGERLGAARAATKRAAEAVIAELDSAT
jgi:hypothetical protein